MPLKSPQSPFASLLATLLARPRRIAPQPNTYTAASTSTRPAFASTPLSDTTAPLRTSLLCIPPNKLGGFSFWDNLPLPPGLRGLHLFLAGRQGRRDCEVAEKAQRNRVVEKCMASKAHEVRVAEQWLGPHRDHAYGLKGAVQRVEAIFLATQPTGNILETG